eukprot:11378111-Karenia_brevis.AAC.1
MSTTDEGAVDVLSEPFDSPMKLSEVVQQVSAEWQYDNARSAEKLAVESLGLHYPNDIEKYIEHRAPHLEPSFLKALKATRMVEYTIGEWQDWTDNEEEVDMRSYSIIRFLFTLQGHIEKCNSMRGSNQSVDYVVRELEQLFCWIRTDIAVAAAKLS